MSFPIVLIRVWDVVAGGSARAQLFVESEVEQDGNIISNDRWRSSRCHSVYTTSRNRQLIICSSGRKSNMTGCFRKQAGLSLLLLISGWFWWRSPTIVLVVVDADAELTELFTLTIPLLDAICMAEACTGF
ncbi:unnamed protein product [Lathyrus oleraceus]